MPLKFWIHLCLFATQVPEHMISAKTESHSINCGLLVFLFTGIFVAYKVNDLLQKSWVTEVNEHEILSILIKRSLRIDTDHGKSIIMSSPY